MGDLRTLWTGGMPLSQAFWAFFVLYGTIANIAALLIALAIISADGPAVLAVGILLLPAPYVVFSAIGVWRSAGAYEGEPRWAAMARIATLVLAAIMIVL